MPGELKRTAMGIYVLEDDDSLSKYVEHYGTLEIPANHRDLTLIARLIPEGGVVIDAGACLGDHTCTYSQIVGASGQVFAFEPHPYSYDALVKNTARLNNVMTWQYALSDHFGQLELQMTPNVGASFIAADEHVWPSVVVPCCTLDTQILPILKRCDFLHLDAEGMEPAILRGARQLIEKFYPALMVEVTDQWLQRYGSSEADLFTLLEAWGYDVTPMLGRRPFYDQQYDILAIHSQRQNIDTPPVVVDTVGTA